MKWRNAVKKALRRLRAEPGHVRAVFFKPISGLDAVNPVIAVPFAQFTIPAYPIRSLRVEVDQVLVNLWEKTVVEFHQRWNFQLLLKTLGLNFAGCLDPYF